jgi:hypothetical protein
LPLICGLLASNDLLACISTLLLRPSDCGRYLVIVGFFAACAARGWNAGERENVSHTFGLFTQLSLSNSPQTFRLKYSCTFPAGKRRRAICEPTPMTRDQKGHKIGAQLLSVIRS